MKILKTCWCWKLEVERDVRELKTKGCWRRESDGNL